MVTGDKGIGSLLNHTAMDKGGLTGIAAQNLKGCLIGDLTQCQNHGQMGHSMNFLIQEETACADFQGCWTIVGGHTTHGVGDTGIHQAQPIMGMTSIITQS